MRMAIAMAMAVPLLVGGCMGSDDRRPTASGWSAVNRADAEKAYRRSIKDAQDRDARARREAESRCRAERGPDAPCNGLIAGNR